MIALTEKQKNILHPETDEMKKISKMDDWKLKYEAKKAQQTINIQLKIQQEHMENMNNLMKQMNENNDIIQESTRLKKLYTQALSKTN